MICLGKGGGGGEDDNNNDSDNGNEADSGFRIHVSFKMVRAFVPNHSRGRGYIYKNWSLEELKTHTTQGLYRMYQQTTIRGILHYRYVSGRQCTNIMTRISLSRFQEFVDVPVKSWWYVFIIP